MDDLQEEKEHLINLVAWYRDEYHKKDFGHSRMIEEINNANNLKDLDIYRQEIDGWID